MPIQPDLPERDQIEMILPPIADCRLPGRKRQAHHEKGDQHVQDKTVDDQGSKF